MSAGKLDRLALKYGTDKASGHHNYTPIYEKYFGHLQNHAFTMWELGIGGEEYIDRGGQSLQMWREYFPKAKIAALDLYEKKLPAVHGVDIYQGDQTDRNILYRMHDGTGKPYLVIDDASHICDLTVKSFEEIFPLLQKGGWYVVEDVQVSYWPELYKGSRDLKSWDTTMGFFLQLTHQLNAFAFQDPQARDGRYADYIEFIHFYPEFILIKKK